MLKINLVCVGNLKDKEYVCLCDEYQKRIQRFAKIKVVELKEKTNFDNISQTIESESMDILSNIDVNSSVLLDRKGENPSSEDFAKMFEKWASIHSELTFVIGGSYGVSEQVRQSIGKKISFGKMTFPHRLARVMLLEQIYRALTINNNVSYHK